jgi:hypothetical protein
LQKKDIVAAQAKANQIRKSVSANSPEQKPLDTRLAYVPAHSAE